MLSPVVNVCALGRFGLQPRAEPSFRVKGIVATGFSSDVNRREVCVGTFLGFIRSPPLLVV